MRKRSIPKLAIATAFAGLLIVAGCGGKTSGSDSNTSETSPRTTSKNPFSAEASGPVSKAKYIKDSAARCVADIEPVQAELDAYRQKEGLDGGKKPTKDQAEEIDRLKTYSVQMAIDVYRRIPPPSDDSEKAQVIPIRRSLETALPEATTTVPATSTAHYAKATRLARIHGYEICHLTR